MLQKLNNFHKEGEVYIAPKNNFETQFGIQHFAGVVHYDSKGTTHKIRKDKLYKNHENDLLKVTTLTTISHTN